jgi:hypothetical protein
MRWADPKTYAWLYANSHTEEYRRELLAFLPADLASQVRKELSAMKVKPGWINLPGCQPLGGSGELRQIENDSADRATDARG